MIKFSTMATKKSLTPSPVSALMKCSSDTRKSVCRFMLQIAVNTVEGKPIAEGVLEKLNAEHSELEIYDLYPVILRFVETIMKLPVSHIKPEVIQEMLNNSTFPEEVITDFVNVLCGPKKEVIFNKLFQSTHHSKLTRMRWRIDITISSSILSRVMEPSICIEMTLSNGSVVVFELTIAKFHELRYNVASVLKEMEMLETRRLVKDSS